jgi:hypothetical protein
MTARRDPDRLIRAFLEDSRVDLPDHVFDVVRNEIDHKRQRVVIGPWREEKMFKYAGFALAAAAVVLIAVVGIQFLPGNGGIGGQPTTSPTPTPSPSPTPRPTAIAGEDGPLQAGVYIAHPFADDPMSFTFTVPSDSWMGIAVDPGQLIGIEWKGANGEQTAGFGFLRLSSLNGDPCQWEGAADDVAVGPTVDDLVTALVSSADYETTEPVATTVSGFSGYQIQVTIQAPLPSGGCDNHAFRIWNADGFDIYAHGPSNRWNLKILDVDGQRVVILAHDFATTDPAIQAELRQISESLQIAP